MAANNLKLKFKKHNKMEEKKAPSVTELQAAAFRIIREQEQHQFKINQLQQELKALVAQINELEKTSEA